MYSCLYNNMLLDPYDLIVLVCLLHFAGIFIIVFFWKINHLHLSNLHMYSLQQKVTYIFNFFRYRSE